MKLEEEYEFLKSKFEENDLVWEIEMPEKDAPDPLALLGSIHKLRLTHVPTGIKIVSEKKRTQLENGIAALKELVDRLESSP